MPYTGIGPYPAGSVENDVIDAIMAGNPPQPPSPQEQAQAYAELQATDFNEAPAGGRISQWLQQNQKAVFAGVGVLVLMSVFKGRR